MAKEEEKDNEQENDKGEKKAGSSKMKIIIIIVVLVLVLGGGIGGGVYYFMSMDSDEVSTEKDADDESSEDDEDEDGEGEDDEDEDSAESDLPPQYLSMDPKFVVSFSDQSKARFMQFSLEVMSRKEDTVKQIKVHMPVLRSSLLMLVGTQTYEDMATRGGKEKLLASVVVDMNATLKKVIGKTEEEPKVEAAYFNSFVIQ